VFIEKSEAKVQELESLRNKFPALADRIQVVVGDCNEYLQVHFERSLRSNSRAVLFLDPFGMQVGWATMEAIASTTTTDVWALFPVSAVNRLLRRDGRLPEGWAAALDRTFGTRDWQDQFYRTRRSKPLFGAQGSRWRKIADYDAICQYYVERLQSIFEAVADTQKWLPDRRRSPLFVLCFAMTNPSERAQALALRIAEHLLEAE
jgi:three-Cys-motif partner protein